MNSLISRHHVSSGMRFKFKLYRYKCPGQTQSLVVCVDLNATSSQTLIFFRGRYKAKQFVSSLTSSVSGTKHCTLKSLFPGLQFRFGFYLGYDATI